MTGPQRQQRPGSPGAVVTLLEESAGFRRVVAELAAELGLPVDEVRREARSSLQEMVAAESPAATAAWTQLGDWLSRAYAVDRGGIDLTHLRALDRTGTLVFLPNHRSYLDPFVLRSILQESGFGPNHVLGGSNLSFFPLGQIGQRTGLVFIRRQFKDAPIYKAMLGLYLAHLVGQGANLEWYIEGGRTRTGKLRPPRMGILSYLVDAFVAAGAQDVTFVPVSIIYDQQHEVGAIAAEESGGTKAPESIRWALRYARAQGVRRGKVHVRFAEPVSLRDILAGTAADEGATDARRAVPKVAFEVCNRINQVTPITAAALVALVLLNDPDRAQSEQEMRNSLLPLLRYVAVRGLPLAEGLSLEHIEILRERSPDEGRKTLATLVKQGVVARFDGGLEPVYSITADRFLEAAFYRNTLSHFFVTRAIVELALAGVGRGHGAPDLQEAVWTEALALRDLLKFEFFFSTKRTFADEVRAEMDIMDPAWSRAQVGAEQILPRLAALPFLASPRILSPFLEAYGVLAARLAETNPTLPVDRDELIAESMGVGRQLVLQRRIHSRESVTKDLFRNALALAENRGLLDVGSDELRVRRERFAAELADVVHRVGMLRRMSAGAPGSGPDAAVGQGEEQG